MAHNALHIEVEQLQNILVVRATGGGEDVAAYRELRRSW